MRTLFGLAALLLVVGSVAGCGRAAWSLVTGDRSWWVTGLLSLYALFFGIRSADQMAPRYQSGRSAQIALLIGLPLALALPVFQIGHYASYGGWLAIALVVCGGALIGLVLLANMLGQAYEGVLGIFKIWL
jgi:hypothetical protein